MKLFNFWPFNIPAKKREAEAKAKKEREERQARELAEHVEIRCRNDSNARYNTLSGLQGYHPYPSMRVRKSHSQSNQTQSAYAAQQHAYDPMQEPLNPLNPFSPISPISIWDTPASASEPTPSRSYDCPVPSSISDDSSRSSNYDSGSSYSSSCDSSSSSFDSSNYDSGSSSSSSYD